MAESDNRYIIGADNGWFGDCDNGADLKSSAGSGCGIKLSSYSKILYVAYSISYCHTSGFGSIMAYK